MAAQHTTFDVVIIGAGPSGLALARALGGAGISVALLDRQPRAALAAPAFDGREIALTQRSVDTLKGLDAWDRIPATEVSPLGEARVINGGSTHALHFAPLGQAAEEPLGRLVPNHLIRLALFESAMACPDITLFDQATATDIKPDRTASTVTLTDGRKLSGRLVVAADTRFSEMRRRMGIPAAMRDFGKTMLVCRMAHDEPHGAVATEWFAYGQTIAMLPLRGIAAEPHMSSLVLTMPAHAIERMMGLDPAEFGAEITQRYERRLGAMRLVGTRHSYPLVGVYASRFVGERFALVGDAAVGMHPVTAHGFNFGLASAATLSALVKQAERTGADIGSARLLHRYEFRHRQTTRPLYLATNATALLYADDSLPARVVRDAVIRVGEVLTPVRRAVVAGLMAGRGGRAPAVLRALMP
jgi:ubiquinone biosynthesis UbiH/UbiF/VisC/COQ6 family hydroxylase